MLKPLSLSHTQVGKEGRGKEREREREPVRVQERKKNNPVFLNVFKAPLGVEEWPCRGAIPGD